MFERQADTTVELAYFDYKVDEARSCRDHRWYILHLYREQLRDMYHRLRYSVTTGDACAYRPSAARCVGALCAFPFCLGPSNIDLF